MSVRPKTPIGTIRLFRGEGSPRPSSPRDDIAFHLTTLRAVASTTLTDLAPAERASYHTITQYVKDLHGTDAYAQFYSQATEAFKDVSSFRLGTVGAYFKGCMIETNLTPHGCSIQAVGALPRPGEDICMHPVFLAEIHDGAYRFKALHGHGVTSKHYDTSAYVFVPQGFQGFAQPERDWLERRVDSFQIYEVNENGTEYTQFQGNVPRRTRALQAQGMLVPEQAAPSYILWLSAIVVAVLLLVLVLRMTNIRFFRYN